MIKKLIASIIATLSFGYAAADPILTSPEVQLERLLEWKKVYGPADVMPGLTAQFKENSKAIRSALPANFLKEFDDVYNRYRPDPFNLRRFNEAYCDFAYILSKHQKEQGGINYFEMTDEGLCAYLTSSPP